MSLILSCLELMKGFKYPDELKMIIYLMGCSLLL